MIKDALGNELKIGDTVHAAGPNGTWVLGIVTQMQQGGISLVANPSRGNGQPLPTTPDTLVLQVMCALEGPAGLPHPAVIKVAAKNVVDQLTESSVKM